MNEKGKYKAAELIPWEDQCFYLVHSANSLIAPASYYLIFCNAARDITIREGLHDLTHLSLTYPVHLMGKKHFEVKIPAVL